MNHLSCKRKSLLIRMKLRGPIRTVKHQLCAWMLRVPMWPKTVWEPASMQIRTQLSCLRALSFAPSNYLASMPNSADAPYNKATRCCCLTAGTYCAYRSVSMGAHETTEAGGCVCVNESKENKQILTQTSCI